MKRYLVTIVLLALVGCGPTHTPGSSPAVATPDSPAGSPSSSGTQALASPSTPGAQASGSATPVGAPAPSHAVSDAGAGTTTVTTGAQGKAPEGPPTQPASTGPRVASGQTASLTATVTFPDQELKTNATVTVKVALKNTGTGPVQLQVPVSTGLALMSISDKFGQAMGGSAAGGMRSQAIRLVTIDPGQSVTQDQQLVLPAGKGSYTFVAQIQGEQGLKTAPITLDVQ